MSAFHVGVAVIVMMVIAAAISLTFIPETSARTGGDASALLSQQQSADFYRGQAM